MLPRDDSRKNMPAKSMGKKENQKSLQARSTIKIPHRDKFITQDQRNNPTNLSFSQVIIFSCYILLLHEDTYAMSEDDL